MRDDPVMTHVKEEGETEIILQRAKECQEPPEALRSEDGSSLKTSVGLWSC